MTKLLSTEDEILISVERICHDLRKGFPIILTKGQEQIIVASAETISPNMLENLLTTIPNPQIVITKNRAKYLYKTDFDNNVVIQLNDQTNIPQICGIADGSDDLELPANSLAPPSANVSIMLANIAEIIPATIIGSIPDTLDTKQINSITTDQVEQYKQTASFTLQESCRTNVALLNHENTVISEIIAFRPNLGGTEHYAIVIGNIKKQTPIVRVHSSCYTGDLLESLECDCYDQLHSAIELMHKAGSGIILYMLQEGRGIGLINKLRAYVLKSQGYDTVDANEVLGFDDDARLFDPAATMLKKMHINEIKLLTNNPLKSRGLEQCGIKVSETVPHKMQPNPHNQAYLNTKENRMGHVK